MSVDYSVSRAYTYQGRYPEELSHNWKSPEGEWLNLREMTDTQLAELGWFPAPERPNPENDFQEVIWDRDLKEYRLEFKKNGAVYKTFWNELMTSGAYGTLKAAASTDLTINTLCTEFIALIADAKFGEPNVPAIQDSLTQIISSVEFSIEDLAEIQALFNATGLNQIYTLE
jgi:hypothetical protein